MISGSYRPHVYPNRRRAEKSRVDEAARTAVKSSKASSAMSGPVEAFYPGWDPDAKPVARPKQKNIFSRAWGAVKREKKVPVALPLSAASEASFDAAKIRAQMVNAYNRGQLVAPKASITPSEGKAEMDPDGDTDSEPRESSWRALSRSASPPLPPSPPSAWMDEELQLKRDERQRRRSISPTRSDLTSVNGDEQVEWDGLRRRRSTNLNFLEASPDSFPEKRTSGYSTPYSIRSRPSGSPSTRHRPVSPGDPIQRRRSISSISSNMRNDPTPPSSFPEAHRTTSRPISVYGPPVPPEDPIQRRRSISSIPNLSSNKWNGPLSFSEVPITRSQLDLVYGHPVSPEDPIQRRRSISSLSSISSISSKMSNGPLGFSEAPLTTSRPNSIQGSPVLQKNDGQAPRELRWDDFRIGRSSSRGRNRLPPLRMSPFFPDSDDNDHASKYFPLQRQNAVRALKTQPSSPKFTSFTSENKEDDSKQRKSNQPYIQYETSNEDSMRRPEPDKSIAPSNIPAIRTLGETDPIPTIKDLQGLCGWQIGGHECFLELSDIPLEKPHRAGREHLGHGRTGIVEEVQCSTGTVTFVRKRIEVPSAFAAQRENAISAIKREIGIMRKVHHPHIVSLIGSYQEKLSYPHYYFLLMYPAGESDLEAFLRVASDEFEYGDIYTKYRQLWRWFGCLASALAFLHQRGIHHEDIKPRNIIYRKDDIYFTDFGSSREIDLISQITSTENPALSTRLYAAPEAMTDEDGNLRRHGSKSDIFSLGIVFVEMLIVLEGKPVSTLRESCRPSTPYHAITHTFQNHFEIHEHFFKEVVQPCLALERSQRLGASELLSLVRLTNGWSRHNCYCRRLHIFTLG